MRLLLPIAMMLATMVTFASVQGQERVAPPARAAEVTLGENPPSMSSELWLYLQEQKRQDDPAMAVRRRAEMKAAQRESRLAASRWFGFSNARPTASTVPIMGTYSPTWVGNSWDPYRWIGRSGPATGVAVRIEHVEARR